MSNLRNKLLVTAASATTVGAVAFGAVGLASAATPTTTTGTASGIPRYTLRAERQTAMAQVLGMSESQLETTLKTTTFKQLLSNQGLTKTTFRTKLKAQLTTDLLADGFSQTQITTAMTHHGHHHLKK